MTVNLNDQTSMYFNLLQQGVPQKDAFKQAFPNGIPSRTQILKDQANQQQKQGYGQLGGLLSGVLAAKGVTNALSNGGNPFGAATTKTLSGLTGNSTTPATTATSTADASTVGAPTGVTASRVPGVSDAASQAADSGSWWTTAPEAGSASQIASGAGALYGGYNAVNDWQHGGSGRTGLTEGGAGVGNMVAGPIGAGVGALYGNVVGYGLQGHGWKNHLALASTNPMLEVARDLGFSPIHETTRQYESANTSNLLKEGTDNQPWQDYVKGMRGQYNTAPADPSKPFDNGKYSNWDEYQKAGLDAKDLTGVYGNLNTFGPDWAGYSQDQRQKITQGLIDNNLYNSQHGDVQVTDPTKAKEIRDQILGTKLTAALNLKGNTK